MKFHSIDNRGLLVVLCATFLSAPFFVFAAPLYDPGETLNPSCAASDPDCTVGPLPVSLGGSGLGSVASGFVPFGAGTSDLATSSALHFDSANGRLTLTNASTTNLSAQTICFTNFADCRTSWVVGASNDVWATTTSQVAGRLIVMPNNLTDIIALGGSATTSAKWWYDPNTTTGYAQGTFTFDTATTSDLVVSDDFTFGNFTGVLKAAAGTVTAAALDLAADVGSSILAVANGGTGRSSIQQNAILLGNGTGAVATTSAGTNGQVLTLASGVPTWVATTTFSGGLTYLGGNVTADLGTSISAAELADGDHGFFSYLTGVASLDTGGLTSANLAAALTNESGATGVLPLFNLSSQAFGDLIQWNGTNWVNIATSTLGINFTNLVGSATDAQVADNLTVSGGTINNTPIGASTPSTAVFTNASTTNFAITGIGSAILSTNANGTVLATTSISSGLLPLTNGYIYRGSSGNTAEATSTLFIANSGNVGVGTTTPSAPFHVDRATAGTVARFEGDFPVIELKDRNGANPVGGSINIIDMNDAIAWRFGSRISVGEQNFEIYDDINDVNRFYIDPNGLVGIGTTDPANLLTIAADLDASDYDTNGQFAIRGTTASTKVLMLGVDTTDNFAYLQSAQDGVANHALVLNPNGGNIGIGTTSPLTKLSVQGTAGANDIFNFASSTGASVLYGSASGNIGIGKTNPQKNLDVAAALTGSAGSFTDRPTMRLTQTSNTSYNIGDIHSALEFQSSDPWGVQSGLQAYIAAATTRANGIGNPDAGLYFGTSIDANTAASYASPAMVITVGGSVGIGTTTPWGKLSVTNTGTGPSLVIEDETSPDSTPFIVDASGNVGIGVANPTLRLMVEDSVASVMSRITNANTSTSAKGIQIKIGPATNPGTANDFIRFMDGDDTVLADIQGDGAGGVTLTNVSDERRKEHIDISTLDALSLISQMRVVDFNMIGSDVRQSGFIAQELYAVLDETTLAGLVSVGGDDEWEEPWGVDYGRLTPLLTRAMQELSSMFTELRDTMLVLVDRMTGTEARLGELEARVQALEAAAGNSYTPPPTPPADDVSDVDDTTVPEVGDSSDDRVEETEPLEIIESEPSVPNEVEEELSAEPEPETATPESDSPDAAEQ